ncbi:tRNA-dihydrouridine synthase 3-like [Clarias magur]|uniref:tRNA-dihydrouridine synthase 3-like n=1 Tax=Clarias magur TaxID=1594786 RepID=A0A8J4U3J5_CLAMG|nr:tRNA-dihydrouridine synthase 3-like [Clarias magur]
MLIGAPEGTHLEGSIYSTSSKEQQEPSRSCSDNVLRFRLGGKRMLRYFARHNARPCLRTIGDGNGIGKQKRGRGQSSGRPNVAYSGFQSCWMTQSRGLIQAGMKKGLFRLTSPC